MGNVAYKPVAPEQIEYPWWDDAAAGHVAVRFRPSIVTNIEVGMNPDGNAVTSVAAFRATTNEPVIDVGMNSSGNHVATLSNLRTANNAPVIEVGMNSGGTHVATFSNFRLGDSNDNI